MRTGKMMYASLALVLLAGGCGPRVLRLGFSPVQVQAAAPAAPTPPPVKMKVLVADKMIQITERVEFETGEATILPGSHELLGQVVDVLKKHPEIELVEVQGHTDDTGNARLNLKLSRDRARSVRQFLVAKGIDAGRLKDKGLGQKRPIVPNDSDENRQKNRRVEFHILKKAEKPAEKGGAGLGSRY